MPAVSDTEIGAHRLGGDEYKTGEREQLMIERGEARTHQNSPRFGTSQLYTWWTLSNLHSGRMTLNVGQERRE